MRTVTTRSTRRERPRGVLEHLVGAGAFPRPTPALEGSFEVDDTIRN
jgi:hypothetical protein